MREVAYALEPWSDELWADMERLACDHFEEVDGGVEPRRRFKLNTVMMQQMQDAGFLKVFIARQCGRLIGYFTWTMMPDIESEGLLIAQQGAWYMEPGHPGAGAALWDLAIKTLRGLDVQCVFPHHREQGRGSHIGRFFESRGAKKIQTTYCLWIGKEPAHARS